MNTITAQYNLPQNYTGIVEAKNATHTLLNGKLYSFNDQPSSVYKDGTRCWSVNDKLHRIGAPAIIYSDGGFNYYLDDRQYADKIYTRENSMKHYWLRCWNEYRTEDNEKLIMARLLSAPK